MANCAPKERQEAWSVQMGAHTNIQQNQWQCDNSHKHCLLNEGIAKSRAILHARVHTLSHSKVDSNVTIHPVENPCIAM